MKRQKKTYRFYLWDYLWWTGERLNDYHNRISGMDILFMYFTFILYAPSISLLALAGLDRSLFLGILLAYLLIVSVWSIWDKKIYGIHRSEAVMKHYADRPFSPARGFLLFFLPVVFYLSMIAVILSSGVLKH